LIKVGSFSGAAKPQIFRKCSCINELSKSLVANGILKIFLKIPVDFQHAFCHRAVFTDI
jgi:hypothetical protein